MQTDIDTNEAAADAELASIQAIVDANETAHTAALSAQAAFDAAAIASLQADVDQNEADADAALATLQADVDQNESDADAALASLTGDLATETAARIADDAAKQVAIDAVQADVDTNETADAAARVVLSTKIDDDIEEAAADAQLAIDTAIGNLIDSAPGVLDTLNELASAIGNDATYAQTVTTTFAQHDADRAAMDAAYKAADVNITALLTAETTARIADVALLQGEIDAEESRALAVEAALQAKASGLSQYGETLTLTSMTTVNLFCETMTVGSMMSSDIPASYTDAATLAAGTNDGMMFYYADVDGASAAPFDDGKKWYFCEGGEWHPSPFYTE
jgi:hypothetical protein